MACFLVIRSGPAFQTSNALIIPAGGSGNNRNSDTHFGNASDLMIAMHPKK